MDAGIYKHSAMIIENIFEDTIIIIEVNYDKQMIYVSPTEPLNPNIIDR
jgi:hypothetical protein